MYRLYAQLYELQTPVLEKGADLQLDVDGLIAFAKQHQAKAILFSNPCNPTGQVASAEQVERLVQSVDCLVVVDEAYMEFSDQSVLPLVERYPNLMVLKTCSKAIGLAGVRLGFAIANPTITRALWAVKSPYNVNSISQAVGQVVLSHPDYLAESCQKLIASRNELYQALCALQTKCQQLQKVYPTHANFVYLQVTDAQRTYQALLDRGIAIRCMGADHLRISAGTPQQNQAVVTALQQIWKGECRL